MKTAERTSVTVEATVHAPVEKVWELWTNPRHITKWNNASQDWHTPRAENDVRVGGKFLSRMEAKEGSAGFDFEGEYSDVQKWNRLAYHMPDGRKVELLFTGNGHTTTVTETFEADNTHPVEMQQAGWQAILDNFKKYAEEYKFEPLHCEIAIDAPVEKVYSTMLDEEHYLEWTAEFNPDSHYKGSWEKGSKILFLGSDQGDGIGGMVARVVENIPNRLVSIEHLGIVKNNEEITSGKEVEGWAGAQEVYTFREVKGKTLLEVDMDTNEEFKAFLSTTWPKALRKLKTICEA